MITARSSARAVPAANRAVLAGGAQTGVHGEVLRLAPVTWRAGGLRLAGYPARHPGGLIGGSPLSLAARQKPSRRPSAIALG
jgi:hypothetical protein